MSGDRFQGGQYQGGRSQGGQYGGQSQDSGSPSWGSLQYSADRAPSSWGRGDQGQGDRSWESQQRLGQTYGGQMSGGQMRGGSGLGGQGYGQDSLRGRGPRGYQRSDDRVRETVSDALKDDDRIDASNIEVQVKDSEVTLTGTVTDRLQKRWAENCDLRGAKDVHNQLRVHHQ